MARSRARGGARLLTLIAAVLLGITGCASIDSPQQEGSGDTGADNRAIKAGGTLRVALSAEPDRLDPTLARTLVGRTVFNAICEKLYDLNDKLEIVPQLAAALPELSGDGRTATVKIRTGVKFADGTALDAAAVKTSLDRHRTLEGSARRSELTSVKEVTVKDPSTIDIQLNEPFAPLSAVLADRAGMIMSPAVVAAKGADFATGPVCVGPFKFTTRIAQDRIEVEKDPNYYDAANVKLDKVIYKIIADQTTRFNNLRSGDVEVLDRVSPVNAEELAGTPNLRLMSTRSLGYQGITVNVGNVSGLGKPPGPLAAPFAGPLATEATVRRAFAMSIDRDALVRSVFRGQFEPACGPISPANPLSSDAAQACAPHDPAGAKKLLSDAGLTTPLQVSLIAANTPDGTRISEAIKSMATEGGFDVQIQPTEFASSLDLTDAGKFQLFQIGWSGRVDPDGNITPFVQTRGSQNISGYSSQQVDDWLNQARAERDASKRKDLYGKVVGTLQQDSPLIYLWREKNLTGVSDKVGQVREYGDGLVRLGTAGFFE
ncbi:MAG TPA: ABC transporter substrate-binding protein [Actinophytocola sp.]|uniref:ABC transporter substrate-binding protein n=1 Tax=Actinophytocola sp. TaxID=1872138 RepID=UPI002DB8DC40|nr:ABC transporter substrate-binding protein [Actinophytocola sp.]HEU5470243.1 ABC transporter substrate-binding protein [Actinophytocola sp.]